MIVCRQIVNFIQIFTRLYFWNFILLRLNRFCLCFWFIKIFILRFKLVSYSSFSKQFRLIILWTILVLNFFIWKWYDLIIIYLLGSFFVLIFFILWQIRFLVFLIMYCALDNLNFWIFPIFLLKASLFFFLWFSLVFLRTDIVTWLLFVFDVIVLLIIIGGKVWKILMIKFLDQTGISKSYSVVAHIKNWLLCNHLLRSKRVTLIQILLLRNLLKLSNLSLHLNHMLLKNNLFLQFKVLMAVNIHLR